MFHQELRRSLHIRELPCSLLCRASQALGLRMPSQTARMSGYVRTDRHIEDASTQHMPLPLWASCFCCTPPASHSHSPPHCQLPPSSHFGPPRPTVSRAPSCVASFSSPDTATSSFVRRQRIPKKGLSNIFILAVGPMALANRKQQYLPCRDAMKSCGRCLVLWHPGIQGDEDGKERCKPCTA
jgi:hypothetical protein